MAAEVMHQWAPALARPCQQDHQQCSRLAAPTPQHQSASSSETSIPGTPVRNPVPASSAAPKRKLDSPAADSMRPRTRQRGVSSRRTGGLNGGSDSTGSRGGAFLALLAVAAHEQQLEEARRARAAAHSPVRTLWQATLAAHVAAALSTLPAEEQQQLQEARRFLALF